MKLDLKVLLKGNLKEYRGALSNGLNTKLMMNVYKGTTWVDMFSDENSWNKYENKDIISLSGLAQHLCGNTKNETLIKIYKNIMNGSIKP